LEDAGFQSLDLPKKIYGNNNEDLERVMATRIRMETVNIMLVGEKGTGKSILSKQICNILAVEMPVIIVDSYEEGFPEMISTINQKAVVWIDEFDKLYDHNKKEETLLSILDGTKDSRISFIMCSNFSANSSFLLNRTKRVRYLLKFGEPTKEVVDEMISDMLENKSHESNLRRIFSIIGKLNIDIITEVIREINMHNQSEPNKIIRMMNAKPESSDFDVEIKVKGVELVGYTNASQNPLNCLDNRKHILWEEKVRKKGTDIEIIVEFDEDQFDEDELKPLSSEKEEEQRRKKMQFAKVRPTYLSQFDDGECVSTKVVDGMIVMEYLYKDFNFLCTFKRKLYVPFAF